MPNHEGSEPHDHDESAPHSHDAPAAPPATTTAAVDVGPSAGGLSVRILLTLLGAAAMIGGAFLDWFSFGAVPEGVDAGASGTEMSVSILWSTDDPFGASFFASIGFVAIVLGLLAILGLALRTGWLTRLAGALAIIVVILYAITLYRVPDADLSISEFGLGVWLVLAGGLLVLIGGFLGTRRIVNTTVPAAPAA
jgi:hypothetical protein